MSNAGNDNEQSEQQSAREPILNLPPLTTAVGGLLLAIHILRQFLDVPTDESLLLSFAVIPSQWLGGPGLLDVLSLITHMLFHGGWLHLIVNLAALLAFGAGVERLLGGARMIAVLLLGGIAGAVLHILIYLHDTTLVIGASGGISALFGLTMFAMAMRSGGWRRLATTSALWLGLNLAFGLIGMPGEDAGIAWVAHMGGYFAGLAYGFWLMRRPIGRR